MTAARTVNTTDVQSIWVRSYNLFKSFCAFYEGFAPVQTNERLNKSRKMSFFIFASTCIVFQFEKTKN